MSADLVARILLVATEHPLAALIAKATLAMAVAFALIGLARRGSAAVRHLIAAATFGVLLLLPLAGLLVPERIVTLARPAAPSRDVQVAAAPLTTANGAGAAPAFTASGVLRGAYGAYLAGVAGLAASLLVGVARLYRLHRRAEVSVSGTRLANEMARARGGTGGIEVAVTPSLAVPITFGWAHPVILLPEETREWDEGELARAIRHELEHVARGDWAAQLVSRLALTLYWPHPFAWLLWRRLRLEAERACDDAVLRDHGPAEPYAEQLVSLARKLGGRGAVPALSMATRTNLGLRVEAILDGGRRRAPRSWLASLAAAAVVVAGAFALAPVRVAAALPLALVQDPAADPEDEADPLDVALLEAAERGNLERMQRMLDRGARANAALDGDGSPLIAAARAGRLDAMKMLIAAGADVNLGVGGDGNALLNAAREGHLEAVRLLLESGADIDRGVPGDGNALIMAAGAGHLDVVRALLDAGASIEKVVPGDENALIHGSEAGQVSVVRLLLEKGAHVNTRVWAEQGGDGRGEWRTALLMARRNRHDEVVRILRAAGARE